MKIKTKLSIGVIFLFAVIIVLGGVGAIFINILARDSKSTIRENYNSLKYSNTMLLKLEEMYLLTIENKSGRDTLIKKNYSENFNELKLSFEENLKAEENNITEVGERELSLQIKTDYMNFLLAISKINLENPPGIINELTLRDLSKYYKRVRDKIFQISELNMQAILRKNEHAQETSKEVLNYITIISTLCFLVGLTFIVNFPSYIANPIKELTESIKQIANKNYDKRLHFKSNDEFGELANAFNDMTEQLQKFESSNLAQVMFEKMRIETIVRNMKDALIILDENKIILSINPLALSIINLPEKEILGKYAPDIAATNDLMRNLIEDLMKITIDESHKNTKPLKIVLEGKEHTYNKEIIGVTTINPHNKEIMPIGNVITLKDITHFFELDAAKTNFLATISHELKTPLSAVDLSVKLLQDERIGHLTERQADLINTIQEENKRLIHLVGELLDISQLESGNIRLSITKVDPNDIINYSKEAIRFPLSQKNINLIINVPVGIPYVKADLEKTVWIMTNLLSNAIRFTDEGGKIEVNVFQENDSLIFNVIDEGPGIAQDYHESIFQKFVQVPGTTRSKGGSGLGLAISKDFIEAQGGKIWLKSELGEGSRFYFNLTLV